MKVVLVVGMLWMLAMSRPWEKGGCKNQVGWGSGTRAIRTKTQVQAPVVILKASDVDRDLGKGCHVRACFEHSLPVTARLNSWSPGAARPGTLWVRLGSRIVSGWAFS